MEHGGFPGGRAEAVTATARPRRFWLIRALGVLAMLLACTPASAQGSGSATLDQVRQRGELRCGLNPLAPGFGMPDSQGVMRGLDADHCRAIAAAIFGDAGKVRFVGTTTQNRFTTLQSGEIDVLVRNTTWTLTREAALGLLFTGIHFYDGTGFLVKKSLNVKQAKELDGATVCVTPGSSTELAVADFFRVHAIKWTPILIQDLTEIRAAFLAGRCDAYSTDLSVLSTFRASQGEKKDDFVLLPDVISKEPLGRVVRKGDDKWFDLIRWTMFALITAEELGVTQANVDSHAASNNPDIRRLLGLEGDLGKALGVDNAFAAHAIRAVGNYGETWERNMAPLDVPRGINRLWTKGGLHYAPPMR
jgi:general L-amino acid transport system substrate-binding protein